MILSDASIREQVACGKLVITPYDDHSVQAASYDLQLGGAEALHLPSHRSIAQRFKLASTMERIELPPDILAQVHGRSSIGRLGVLVHFTAGLIDPGFKGHITLECMALDEAQTFYPGDRIAQLTFHWLDQPAKQPYNGRYQDQVGAVPSKFQHCFEERGS